MQTQPFKDGFSGDITAGTRLFFADCDIIEHQHIAGVKAPALRFIDTEKRLTNVNIQITSATKHKLLLELQFTELDLNTIKEIFIVLVAVSGDYLPFVGNNRVGITLKFGKLWQCCPTFLGKLWCLTFRATQDREEAFYDI